MAYFKELEGDAAILSASGVYIQAPLFTRNGYLFAKVSGGFVKLGTDGSTSKAKLRLEELITNAPLFRDKFGRLCDGTVNGAAALPKSESERLLLGRE